MRSLIAVAALIVILVLVNVSIAGKQKQIAAGAVVHLPLAPVDPRSLMQGDYMALRFEMANNILTAVRSEQRDNVGRRQLAADGHVVVQLDEQRVGRFARLDDGSPLAVNEARMRYRVRKGQVKFATNAFFFQEGDAELYQPARFGEFRLDKSGDLLLVAMRDENLQRLGPAGE